MQVISLGTFSQIEKRLQAAFASYIQLDGRGDFKGNMSLTDYSPGKDVDCYGGIRTEIRYALLLDDCLDKYIDGNGKTSRFKKLSFTSGGGKNMNRTIRQHYVSEFYIRKFSENAKIVFARSKDGKISRYLPILDLAQGKKYYDIEIDEDQLTEDGKRIFSMDAPYVFRDKGKLVASIDPFFKNNEDEVSKVINKIEQKILFNHFTIEDKEHLALFVLMLLLRGEQSNKLLDDLLLDEAFREIAYSANKYFTSKLDNKDLDKLAWMNCIVNAVYDGELLTKLLYRRWMFLYIKKGGNKFITSDNPVIIYLPNYNRFLYSGSVGVGIMTPGVQIMLPLSPYALLLLDYSNIELNGPCVYETNSEFVSRINSIERRQSFRWTLGSES